MFKDNLKTLRKEKNLTQPEMAKILNISQGTIGNWETGNRVPDVQMLITIADFFGVTVDCLLRGQPYTVEFSFSEKEKRLISAYRNQPDIQLAVDRLLGLDQPLHLAAFGGNKSTTSPTASIEDVANLLSDIEEGDE